MSTQFRRTSLTIVISLGLWAGMASSGVQAHDGYDKAIQAYSCVDYEKALSLFKTYAKEGHGLSQYMMGIMTEQGQGTAADVKAAFDYYMTAARQGIPDAYFALADMYAKGAAVAKDPVQAYAWFELAMQGGHKLAGDMVNSLAKQLQPEQIEQARKMNQAWLVSLRP